MKDRSGRLYKHQTLDKWEAYLPNKTNFVHGDYSVSSSQDQFHMSNAFCAREGNRRGFRMGVQKRITRIAGAGICVDSKYIGKADS